MKQPRGVKRCVHDCRYNFVFTLKMEMSEEKKASIVDLLRTPNMRKKTLAMSFNWMACGLCFYGLAQYVSTIGGNIFVNVALAGWLTSFILVFLKIFRIGVLAETYLGINHYQVMVAIVYILRQKHEWRMRSLD